MTYIIMFLKGRSLLCVASALLYIGTDINRMQIAVFAYFA